MPAPTLRETVHVLLYRLVLAAIGVGSIVAIYRVKHTTPYLGFVPQDPVLLVIWMSIGLGAIGLGWFIYQEL